jgi:hypothetical protein
MHQMWTVRMSTCVSFCKGSLHVLRLDDEYREGAHATAGGAQAAAGAGSRECVPSDVDSEAWSTSLTFSKGSMHCVGFRHCRTDTASVVREYHSTSGAVLCQWLDTLSHSLLLP